MRLILYLILALPVLLLGQNLSLRGQVTDESGAAVPAANIVLNGPSGVIKRLALGKTAVCIFRLTSRRLHD